MWLVISGPPASSKQKIIEWIEHEKLGFEYLPPEEVMVSGKITQEIRLSSAIDTHKKAAEKCSDVVTIGCVWDVLKVYNPVALEFGDINQDRFDAMERLERLTEKNDFAIPDAVVYIKPVEKMASFNRMSLNLGSVMNQDRFQKICDLYDEYIQSVAISVVDVDHGSKFDDVIDQLDFGISSIKQSGVGEQTIWTRRMFR